MLILLIILLLGFLVNLLYKRTNHYYNQYEFYKEYFGVENLMSINMAMTGTSNAVAAAASMKGNNILILARQNQSLRLDSFLLDNVIEKLPPGCIVYIVLSPCVLLYDRGLYSDLFYHAPLISTGIIKPNILLSIERAVPILFHPQYCVRLIFDCAKKKSYYADYMNPITIEDAEKNMKALVNSWKKQFNIPDFTDVSIREKNKRTIEINKEIIKSMVARCHDHSLFPILVVTPFSQTLKQHFSESFLSKYFYDNIRSISKDSNTQIIDMMNEDDFDRSISFFKDGGFVLNKVGSRVFMRKLIKQTKRIYNNDY